MSDYREAANEFRRDARWTMWRFLPIILAALGILFGLKAACVYGNTVTERKVFENSYQRSESLKSQMAVDEAALAEIKHLLSNPDLSANSRRSLEAQASAARIRLATTKRKQ